jgi:hypothetical protein
VLSSVAVPAGGQDVADFIRPATTEGHAVVCLDAVGRIAISTATFVLLEKRLPLGERKVRVSGREASFVAGYTNIGTGSVQIPKAPLPVVIEGSTRILRVLPSLSVSLTGAQLVSVLLVIAQFAFASQLTVALVPRLITKTSSFRELGIARVPFAFRPEN